ncbi:hypothetical protein MM817_02015 [Acidibacillus sp. S0AB]|uniref:Uncharacterized protein n=1 Tax=Sulfoacidibacillus ferrooxidans TaxID=2005001 RepID=A0A9X1VA59_9BACL|nr:hypothetical protein [Sulfoacidibacillus ferrooxidans]
MRFADQIVLICGILYMGEDYVETNLGGNQFAAFCP